MTSPELVVTLFSLMDLLNFIDRGIIPGSTVEFNHFIRDTTGSSSPDILLGLLQSAFVVGFIIGSIIFGNMVHHYKSFFLVKVGMSIWLLSTCLSFAAYFANSYEFLMFARMISGFGEASLQSTVPPWIQHHIAPKKRGMWLSIFYTTLPLGTALGYAYSSSISTAVGWGWAFFGETIVMVPILLYFCLLNEESIVGKKPLAPSNTSETLSTTPFPPTDSTDSPSELLITSSNTTTTTVTTATVPLTPFKPTIWMELQRICQEPIYVCLICGYAAQVGSIMALATFGSPILMGFGYFDDESSASTTFGIIVSLAGILGTPLGGFLQDKLTAWYLTSSSQAPSQTSSQTSNSAMLTTNTNPITSHVDSETAVSVSEVSLANREVVNPVTDKVVDHSDQDNEEEFKEETKEEDIFHSITGTVLYQYISIVIVCMIVIGILSTFFLGIVYLVYDKVWLLLLIGLGCLFSFMTITGTTITFMLTVPIEHRSFAVSFGNIIGHVLGDVPSPILAGWIKDELAPNCVVSGSDDDDSSSGNALTSDACRDEGDQLRLFFLIIVLWSIWYILFFLAAWYLCHQKVLQLKEEEGKGTKVKSDGENGNGDTKVVEEVNVLVIRQMSSDKIPL